MNSIAKLYSDRYFFVATKLDWQKGQQTWRETLKPIFDFYLQHGEAFRKGNVIATGFPGMFDSADLDRYFIFLLYDGRYYGLHGTIEQIKNNSLPYYPIHPG
jgi:hypothetical protein